MSSDTNGTGHYRRSGTEGFCDDCDESYTVWYADNSLWNAVMRPYGEVGGEPFLCARCFLIRAQDTGQTNCARVTWPQDFQNSPEGRIANVLALCETWEDGVSPEASAMAAEIRAALASSNGSS